MITRKELKELASYMVEDALFISLYLNVDPTSQNKDEWLIHFRNMSRDTLKTLETADKKQVEKDLDEIERFLRDRPEGMKRGMAIIKCGAKGFLRVYHTALPFTNQLVVEHDPYIKPLATMGDLYQTYLVVVVGRTRARVLLTTMGEIEEITNVVRERIDVDSGKAGSWGDHDEVHAERTKEKEYRILHKDLLKVIEKVISEEGVKRILIGGTDRGRGVFKDSLSNSLKERIVSEFAIDRYANNREIFNKIVPLMKEVEYNFERKALDELFDQSRKVALGLSDVLTALQQGNVHKMYVLSDVTAPGMICSQCGAVTPERDTPCPYCSGEMRRVPYMLDHAIQRAIEQDARVDMLDYAPRLREVGGIGAIMRY